MASRKNREDLCPQWLKAIVCRRIAECYDADDSGDRIPAIRFTARGAQDIAVSARHGLSVNPALLLAYPEDMLAEGIPHAVAHHLLGTSSHRDDWREMAIRCGGENPKRAHGYEVTENRPHLYRCACDGVTHRMTGRQHVKSHVSDDGARLSKACTACGERRQYYGDDADTALRIDAAGLARVLAGSSVAAEPEPARGPVEPGEVIQADFEVAPDGEGNAPQTSTKAVELYERAEPSHFDFEAAKEFMAAQGIDANSTANYYGDSQLWEGCDAAIWAILDIGGQQYGVLHPWQTITTLSVELAALALHYNGTVESYVTSTGERGGQ
jgi:predicted SprT family Zn-dependent metalloprotease